MYLPAFVGVYPLNSNKDVNIFLNKRYFYELKKIKEAANGQANGSGEKQQSNGGTMVKTFQAYLPPSNRTYSCVHCRAHLASHDELISKSFQGSQGRAYLFNSVVNVACGQAEERVLLTGLHAVADIYCECCKTPLGWKYEHAFESSQKYKEGKYIIELAHMIKENGWD
uniref:CSON014962 protein n=1 Tax=Culicoides sonorensis TaxID=179676 RepID=A0A336MCH5_CULSO